MASTRCRWGRVTNHVHVWSSLLEQAGFTLADIPKQWEAFWSFWCDQVQPAVRKATRPRRHLRRRPAPCRPTRPTQTDEFEQFMEAYEADYVTRDGKLVIDDPEIRRRLIKAIDSYTAIYRKGCTPPDAVSWDNLGNNKAFLAQTVVMTANPSLSIPNALKAERPEDYYKNAATIEWPDGADGQPLAIEAGVLRGRGLQGRRSMRRWPRSSCASWSARAGSRTISTSPATACCRRCRSCSMQPFWLDPSDPHRMAAAMQFLTRPRAYELCAWPRATGGTQLVDREDVWAEGRPPRRRRGHQPRAGGRRGDRPHQADPEE